MVFEVTTSKKIASLLGGTNSVLVIWGLIVYSVFCQILPRKTVNPFSTASFTSRYKFSYRALARQPRLSDSCFASFKTAISDIFTIQYPVPLFSLCTALKLFRRPLVRKHHILENKQHKTQTNC